MGDFYKAKLVDNNEKLNYKITFDESLELLFTDKIGESIGLAIENSLIFNEDEWNQLIIRNSSNDSNVIELKIEALSYSNILQKYKPNESRLIKWKPIPLLEFESDIDVFSDKLNTKSGEQVNLEINLETPKIANSSLLVIKTPLGSELVFKDEIILADYNINNNNFYYLKLNKNEKLINLGIKNPDIYSGEYKGSIDFYTSVREDLNKSYLENLLQSDLNNKLTTKKENNLFTWQVSQVAFDPEFNNSQLISNGFDSNDGK